MSTFSTYANSIRTGDVVLFSGNTPTGFLLRTLVSSEWNHSGIAVRFINKRDQKEISLTDEGDLYILETNTGNRVDDVFGYEIVGAGFSRCDWVTNKYNKVAVRHLHDIFRTRELADLTLSFTNRYRGSQFPSNTLPFFSVWLGIPLAEALAGTSYETQSGTSYEKDQQEMFCSELMAHYYSYCIGPQYEKLTGIPFNNKLSTLFGNESPLAENMFTPGHYTSIKTPNASIFSGTEEIVYIAHADMLYVILQPLLIILIVMLGIWMTLPH